MAGGEVLQAMEEMLTGHVEPGSGVLHYDESFGKRLADWVLWVQTFDITSLHT